MPHDVVQVASAWEEHSYIAETRCSCGEEYNPSVWEIHRDGGKTLEVCRATCVGCGVVREFWFDITSVLRLGGTNIISDLESAWPPVARGKRYFTDHKALSQATEALLQRAEAESMSQEEFRAAFSDIRARMIPRLLGRYEVLGTRQGGMSTLYLCSDPRTQDQRGYVVCKVVQAVDQMDRQALRREADIWLKFGRHRNLVSLYDVGAASNEQMVLVLEAVLPGAGGRISVRDWLLAGALSPQRALDIIRGVIRGMLHCRARVPLFVHGDLKPENLLLSLGYEVKLTDFGLARSQDTPGLKLGRAWGTPDYLAPECWSGFDASEASDVYALGIVAYELLMERHPFLRTRPEDLQFAHEREFVHIQHPLLSGTVAELLNRCVSKSPLERPTFEELAQELGVSDVAEETSESPVIAAMDANNRGTALTALGRDAEAIQQYKEALMLKVSETPDALVLVNLAISLSRSGKFELADLAYRKTLEAERSPHGLAGYAAHILRSRQRARYDEALRFCDEALSLDPTFFPAQVTKAALLNSLGRHAEAVVVGEAALKVDPSNPYALFETAFGCAKEGKRNRAWKLVERVLRVNPEFEPAQELRQLLRKDK